MSSFLPEKMAGLLSWMSERERAREAREAGRPMPADLDPVIREWRFCNVDRRDDRVTRWIRDEIVAKHADSPALWFNLVIARLINWPPTLRVLSYCEAWQPDHFKWTLSSLTEAGHKAYTGAYMIPAGPKGEPKEAYLARVCLGPLWEASDFRPLKDAPLEEWSRFLRRVPVMGDFLRNQVVADLRDTPACASSPDWETFVLGGPGTVRGFNRLLGWKLERAWTQSEIAVAVPILRRNLVRREPRWAGVLRDPNNLTNCLCEFDKWERVRNGEGKPRARYSPDPAPLPPRRARLPRTA